MNNTSIRPSVEFLKRKAKLIRKTNGITHTMALNMLAVEHGFRDWKHYIEDIKLKQRIRRKPRRLKRPSMLAPPQIEYHDVFNCRVIGQRPNRTIVGSTT